MIEKFQENARSPACMASWHDGRLRRRPDLGDRLGSRLPLIAEERMLDRFRSLDTQGSTRSWLHEVDRPGLHAALNWRLKYLASALILGPFTLHRPVIAILGAALGVALSNDAAVAAADGLSVFAVLAVEPLAGCPWYARNTLGPAG